MISEQCQLRPWFIHSTVMIYEYLISEGTEADRLFGLMNYNHCSKLLARFFGKFVSILNHDRLFTHKNTENGWQLWKLFSRVKIYEKRHANNIGILLLFFPFKSLGSCIMRFRNSIPRVFRGEIEGKPLEMCLKIVFRCLQTIGVEISPPDAYVHRSGRVGRKLNSVRRNRF